MKLTIKELNQKANLLNSIITPDNDKLNYAARKLFKNIETATNTPKKEYNEQLEDLRIKYASTYPADYEEAEGKGKEKRGSLVTDDKGNYSYTKENTDKFNAEVRPINSTFENSTVEIEPFFAGKGTGYERVATLNLFTIDELKGLLFKEDFDAEAESTKLVEVVAPSIDESPVEEQPSIEV